MRAGNGRSRRHLRAAFRSDRSDERVTAQRHAHQVALCAAPVTQHPAQGSYMYTQIGFLDDHAIPDGVDEVFLGDYLAGVLTEYAQEIECTAPDLERLART